eukprot:1431433-Pyramimonas_sp.AAC.1
MLEATSPPSVKLLPNIKLQDHEWKGSLRRTAWAALPTGLGLRQGRATHKGKDWRRGHAGRRGYARMTHELTMTMMDGDGDRGGR